MKRKSIICLTLAIAMCFSLLAGCGTTPAQSPTPPSSPGSPTTPGGPAVNPPPPVAPPVEGVTYADSITVLLDNNKPATLDVRNPASGGNATRWMLLLFLDRLVELNNFTGEYVPNLATKWETDDWQHITFYLRDDVYFHNGDHFTAADVVYTIEQGKASPGTVAFDKWGFVESTNIVNDYTLELTLKNPHVDFISELISGNSGIINKRAIEADPDKGPWIGTGPWMVSEFVSNDHGTFVVNENYWGEVPVTKQLTLKYVEEQAAHLMMLENGEVQATAGLNPIDYPLMETDPRFISYSFTTHNVSYLAFNMNDPIMGDLNFRRAVAHAVNREDIVAIARNGYGKVPEHGSFWGYGTQFTNSDIPLLPRDLNKAKEYLAQSNYNNETVEIVAAFETFIMTAQVVQQNLAEIGINARIFETDGPGIMSYATFSNNQAQMVAFTGAWTYPASTARPYLYPGSANNRASYSNDIVSDLFDRAGTTVDIVEREALYRQIQEIVAEDLPFINLYWITAVVGALKGVENVNLGNDAQHDFRYIRMVLE